jgi:hypothetical protein
VQSLQDIYMPRMEGGASTTEYMYCQKCIPKEETEERSTNTGVKQQSPRHPLQIEPVHGGESFEVNKHDLETLEPEQWLNDTIVNLYFARMVEQWGESYVQRISSFVFLSEKVKNQDLDYMKKFVDECMLSHDCTSPS